MEKYQFTSTELELIERSPVPFAIYQFLDKRVVTLALTQGFCDLFGYERQEAYYLMDNDMYCDTHPDDVSRIADAAFRFATEGGIYQVVYRSRNHKDPGYIIVHATGEHIFTKTGERLAIVWYIAEGKYNETGNSREKLNDLFSIELHDDSMFYHDHYDFLTGLPNMSYFFELAEAGREEINAENKEALILFFDLRGMKHFNKKYGFAEGDNLLREFGKLLVKYFSNENCGRIGQDHFAVFTNTENIGEILNELIEETKTINDGKNLPVRIGIYLDGIERVEASRACDRAKYACEINRSAYVSGYTYFDKSMLEKALTRQYIIENFDKAIEEKRIQVYYQPIIRAANGRVCEEEALARWDDPEKGFLLPADFISTLEDARLITKLDLYVLEESIRKMKRLSEAGLYIVPCSINLSRVDFDTCDIISEICKRIDASGLSRSLFNLEITESIVGSDFDFMKSQIERMRAEGFRVWMDDFGSGYSSLDVLQDIEFDLIKFDMRFMMQFDGSDRSKIIITELLKMAMGLGVETIVEGVERKDQMEFLREVGCTKLQGFYYSKALPLQEILRRYEKGEQIGFENPDESSYYEAIGRINIYDPGLITNEDQDKYEYLYNAFPMAILEVKDEEIRIIRCNRSYRRFFEKSFKKKTSDQEFNKLMIKASPDLELKEAMDRCQNTNDWVSLDTTTEDGQNIHSFIRRLADNPVTGTSAYTIVILAMM